MDNNHIQFLFMIYLRIFFLHTATPVPLQYAELIAFGM